MSPVDESLLPPVYRRLDDRVAGPYTVPQKAVFAVVELGGTQYKVTPDDVVICEKLSGLDINDKVGQGRTGARSASCPWRCYSMYGSRCCLCAARAPEALAPCDGCRWSLAAFCCWAAVQRRSSAGPTLPTHALLLLWRCVVLSGAPLCWKIQRDEVLLPPCLVPSFCCAVCWVHERRAAGTAASDQAITLIKP